MRPSVLQRAHGMPKSSDASLEFLSFCREICGLGVLSMMQAHCNNNRDAEVLTSILLLQRQISTAPLRWRLLH